MSGLSGASALATPVALQGHLLDSLTLSKVMDQIQQLGGDYRLNDIRVGSLKNELSAIRMTLLAPDEATLQTLLETLSPYGLSVQPPTSVETVLCAQDGQAPEDAFVAQLPQKALVAGQWQAIEQGGPWVLVLREHRPVLTPVAALKTGDALVIGASGLQWPT